MAVNSSTTCSVKGSLIRTAVASMRPNFYVRWNIFTVSTSSIGNWGLTFPYLFLNSFIVVISNQRTFFWIIQGTLRCVISVNDNFCSRLRDFTYPFMDRALQVKHVRN